MQAWDDFIKRQEALLGKEIAEKWLRSLKVVHFDSGNLYLEAKDSFQVLWFEEHIRSLLKSQLLNNNFRPIKVHLTVAEADTATPKFSNKEKGKNTPPLSFPRDKIDSAMTLENFIPGEANKIVFRFFSELMSNVAAFIPSLVENPTFDKVSAPGLQKAKPMSKQPMCKHMGDADICKDGDAGAVKNGVFNQTQYNPIYLWGGPGSGKTHLLMALTQEFNKRGLNALYARAETFTEHVVSAIRGSAMDAFRKAYRHADVLLIDDVHVFARKDATQEEFFHTFNTLHTSGRQIILSSKCAPALLEEIEPRLVSRFEWGINLHFEKLGTQELKEVLKRRSEGFNFPLSSDVSEFLVETFSSSKSLHKALEALILRCHLDGDVRHKRNSLTLDRESAKKMLADLCAEEIKVALTPEKIIGAVSSLYGMRPEDLLGKAQNQECSLPRQIAMYLCRQELKLPFQSIGQIFSRDHSTVMTSIKQIEKKINGNDKEILHSLSEIRLVL